MDVAEKHEIEQEEEEMVMADLGRQREVRRPRRTRKGFSKTRCRRRLEQVRAFP